MSKKRIETLYSVSIITIFLTAIISISSRGQDETKEKEKKADPKTELTGTVFLVVNDSHPSNIIALDDNGKWISSVKAIEMKFEIGAPVLVSCTMYEGVIKPSKPLIKTMTLAQLKTVSALEFKTMIDNLQTDPEAVKTMLMKSK